MAEVPFKQTDNSKQADDFSPDTLEPQEERGVEVFQPNAHAIAKPGDMHFTARLKPVYISIAHGVGGLSEAGYPKGALVIGKEIEVYAPPRPAKPGEAPAKDEPAVATILSVDEYWKEEVKFGSGSIPRTWRDEAAAIADGMTTKYPPWGSGLPMPNARPALSIKMLIREPDGVQNRGHFLIELGGKWWAPCTMIADKTAYGEAVDPITRAQYTHGASKIYSATFALSTRSKLAKSTNNFTYVPVFRVIGTKTPDEVNELLTKLNGGK